MAEIRNATGQQHARAAGTGPGLSPRKLGQKGGTETVTLAATQIPSHTHRARCLKAVGTTNIAENNFWSKDAGSGSATYHAGPADANMAAGAIGNTGGSQAHANIQTFQVVNFIIALVGTFPSRN